MKKICSLIFTSILIVLNSFVTYGQGGTWVKYNVGYNYIFRGIDFPSSQDNTGFMAGESLTYSGDGIVIKTTNGGATWTQIWTGTNEGVEGASFPDLNTGYIAGWPNVSAGWSGVGKTTNGGTTWTSLNVVSDVYYFTDIVFKDAQNGIVLGSTNTNPGVWYTSNGGSTWNAASGINSVPNHACYLSGNTYFLVDNSGKIKKSTDNGATWNNVYSNPALLLLGIDRFDNSTIMACGDNGKLVKSYDGGATWNLQTIGTDLWHDFGWVDANNVFICGTPELIYGSTNGGSNWTNRYPGSTHQAALYECIFTPNGTGFICGSQGTLMKRDPVVVAGFTASPTTLCPGGTVHFQNQSSGTSLTYNWTFPGGVPATSTAINPDVVYPAPGNYDVQLIANNGTTGDTLLQPSYIQVFTIPAAPVITFDTLTLTSNVADSNQWYINGNLIPGATTQSLIPTVSGWYWDVVSSNGCKSDTSNHIFVFLESTNDLANEHITISPDPNSGKFLITLPGPGLDGVTIKVWSVTGLCIFSKEFPSGGSIKTIPVDLDHPSAGIYILELSSAGVNVVRRFVVIPS